MKTKQYLFTKPEVMAIRDALDTQWFSIRDHKPNSPIAIERQKLTRELFVQFNTDYAKLYREKLICK